MAEPRTLEPVTAFAHLAIAAGHGATAGVTVAEHRGLGLATVTLRRGAEAAFATTVGENFAIIPVNGPKVSAGGDVAFVGTGPGRWLAVRPRGGWRFARDLAASLDGIASVADQSSGYAVLRLSGPRARDVLAKGVPIDLHPAAFAPGDAAVTLAGHVGIVLWQVGAEPSYDIAVFRSYAGDVWHWLETGAAEFGLAVGAPLD